MAKNISLLLVIMAFGTISNSAMAVEVRGFPTCATWLEQGNLRAFPAMTNEFWLLGYLSGKAVGLNKDLLMGTDNDTIYHWIDNYCRAYSTKDVADAARDLAKELIERKGL